MFPGSNSDDRMKQNFQENLSKRFISSVFDALKATFGADAAERYLKNDLDESWQPQTQGGFENDFSEIQAADRNKNWTNATVSDVPVDLFRETYNRIFPRTVRHALGEYYTPPWLAS